MGPADEDLDVSSLCFCLGVMFGDRVSVSVLALNLYILQFIYNHLGLSD